MPLLTEKPPKGFEKVLDASVAELVGHGALSLAGRARPAVSAPVRASASAGAFLPAPGPILRFSEKMRRISGLASSCRISARATSPATASPSVKAESSGSVECRSCWWGAGPRAGA